MTGTVALKRIARIVAGQSPPSETVGQLGDGLPFMQGNAEFGLVHPTPQHSCDTAPKRCEAGDVLLSVRAPVGALNVAETAAGIGRGLCAVRPDGIDGRYLWWALHALRGELMSVAVGSTYDAVTADQVGNLRIPQVGAAIEAKIADVLDAETARIDALVRKRRRMMQLVQDRQQQLVRDRIAFSGAPIPLKRRWTIVDCKHLTPTYVASGYPVVSPGDVTPGALDLLRCHRFVGEKDFADLTQGRRPRRGDIIYSRNASIGIAALVTTDEPFTMGQDVCMISSVDQSQRYLTYVLNSIGRDQLEEAKIGSTFSRVNIPQIAELLIPTPVPGQQDRIADELDADAERSQALLESLTHQIELLREHREALITAAVTGQIDVTKRAS